MKLLELQKKSAEAKPNSWASLISSSCSVKA